MKIEISEQVFNILGLVLVVGIVCSALISTLKPKNIHDYFEEEIHE